MGKFEKLIWTNKYSIGNTEIDKVNIQLIDIYNDLIEYSKTRGNRTKLAMILSKMTDYSLEHFKKEEEYMQRLSYPELTKHKRFHRDFIYTVAIYNVELLGVHPPAIKEIINFLDNWLVNHILNCDIKYEAYKKEIKSEVTY